MNYKKKVFTKQLAGWLRLQDGDDGWSPTKLMAHKKKCRKDQLTQAVCCVVR